MGSKFYLSGYRITKIVNNTYLIISNLTNNALEVQIKNNFKVKNRKGFKNQKSFLNFLKRELPSCSLKEYLEIKLKDCSIYGTNKRFYVKCNEKIKIEIDKEIKVYKDYELLQTLPIASYSSILENLKKILKK